LTLHAKLVCGPSRPHASSRRLQVRTNHGYRTVFTTHGGEEAIRVPVPRGKTTIMLQGLDRPTVWPLANGDKRILLVGVQDLQIRFTSTKARVRAAENTGKRYTSCAPCPSGLETELLRRRIHGPIPLLEPDRAGL